MSDLDLDATVDQPRMRVDVLTPTVQVSPGEPVMLEVLILNTTPVIETVTVQLVSLISAATALEMASVMIESTTQHPESITLFPEENLQTELEVVFAAALPAGTYEGVVLVTGGSGTVLPTERKVLVEVPARSSLTVQVEPPVRTGGRSERFEVLVDNAGNTPLDVRLLAVDAERVCELIFNRPKLRLQVEQYGTSDLLIKAKRKWTGSPTDHAVTVTAETGELVETTQVLYRQKAVLTPGVITLLVLALIVALWATAMLFGIRTAFEDSSPVKTRPTSFFTGISNENLDPALVGGTIEGVVVAESNAGPIERVTVEVFNGRGELVTASATDADGAYELDSLLPGRYRLRMRATGFEERWYPAATDASGAAQLMVSASEPTEAGATTLTGLPAELGGLVVAGDGDPVATEVVLVAVDLVDADGQLVDGREASFPTDENGVWLATGLTAPATYRISYRAANYDLVEVTQVVGGGERLTANPVRLPASPGTIAGTVRFLDPDLGVEVELGGVQVLAQRGDLELSTTTPTSGEIGTFAFDDLPTPGTYLLSFTADGYASETQAVRLGAGETVLDLPVLLFPATGTITGLVSAVTGGGTQARGGVTVTVTGGDTVLTTDTLSSGAIGSFRVPGLPLPGTYTVNFDLDGFVRVTRQVTIGPDQPRGTADATLESSVGAIRGRVEETSGTAIVGASVSISDGANVRETTTASAPADERGNFGVSNLPVGTYTITATTPDGRSFTQLVEVRAGDTQRVTLRVPQ